LDLYDFYIIKPLWVRHFGAEILNEFKKKLGVHVGGAKFLTRMLSLILRTNFHEFGQKILE
jgi:hypothetical protein